MAVRTVKSSDKSSVLQDEKSMVHMCLFDAIKQNLQEKALIEKKRLTCEFTWYSISLGVACSPLATGSGVTATIGEAGSVCCCDGGGAGLGGSSSL